MPARIFTSSDPQVLAPVAAKGDDPRRDPARQTEDGLFSARCPGAAQVSITSGFETTSKAVRVASRARADRARRARRTGRGRCAPAGAAGVRWRGAPRPAGAGAGAGAPPRQDRAGAARRLPEARQQAAASRWDGRVRRRGKLRAVKAGRYRARCSCARTAGRSAARPSWSCASAARPVGRRAHVARLGGGAEQRGQGVAHAEAAPGLRGRRLHRARARAGGLQLGDPGARLVQLLHRVLEAVLERGHLLAQAQPELVALDPQVGDLRLGLLEPGQQGARVLDGVRPIGRAPSTSGRASAAAARWRWSISQRPAGRVAGSLPRSIRRRMSRAVRPLARAACSMSRLPMTVRQLRRCGPLPCPLRRGRTCPGRPTASDRTARRAAAC